MQVRRTVSFGLASVGVATWLTAASVPEARPPVLPSMLERPPQVVASALVLDTEVARLHARLAPSASPDGKRDLFRFPSKPLRTTRLSASAPPARVAPSAAPAVPVPLTPPSLVLIGVAEDTSSDGPVRTAIVSGFGDVFLVKPGDLISGRYRVAAVSSGSVDLVDTATTAPTTLALR